MSIYRSMFKKFGHQNWWPGETPFEIAVGAVLTQNTSWGNVERAIDNLKNAGALDPFVLRTLPVSSLAEFIKPAGYFNVKAQRLKALVDFICDELEGDVTLLKRFPVLTAREKLLSVNGVGKETADSILLYAVGLPIFVIDAYTRRILGRLGLCEPDTEYDVMQSLFMKHLPEDVALYNDYHAQFVRLAKVHCRKKPLCKGCPLKKWCSFSAGE